MMGTEVEKVIEVRHIKKIYHMGKERIPAVDDVSFEIYKGEFCCLLGTSGSGKSTLLNLMAGIEKASGGEIIIKGKSIRKMNENKLAKFRQNYLGFVFQSYNLMNSMNALENVEFPLVFKRMGGKKRKKLATQMLVQVGLGYRLNHKPKEMSGGQQQRVGIARAFVAKPEIVFADEPTGNLDTKTAMEVMNLILGIARRNSQTIVMVTHDPRLAEYADKVIHILDGRIQDVEIRRTMEQIQEESKKAIEDAAREDAARKEELKAKREAYHARLQAKKLGIPLPPETLAEVPEEQRDKNQVQDTRDKEGKPDSPLEETAITDVQIDAIQIQPPQHSLKNKKLQQSLSNDVARIVDEKMTDNQEERDATCRENDGTQKGEEKNEKK